MTPYTTKTGVRIGSRYTPGPPHPTADEEALQALLLNLRPRRWSRGEAAFVAAVVLGAVGALLYKVLTP